MKLIINVSKNFFGGGFQVALSFIHECRNFPEHTYYVFANQRVLSQLDISDFPENFVFYPIPRLKFYQFHRYLSKLERNIRPDVVFSVFGPAYWKPFVPHLSGYAIAHYLYPESPYWKIIPWWQNWIMRLKKKIHLYYIRKETQAIVCETQDVTDRIAAIFPDKKYFTVSNTYSNVFGCKDSQTCCVKLEVSEAFRFLTVSRYYPHKNFTILRGIADELKKRQIRNIQFVLTITQEEYKRLFGDDYLDYVITVGPVPVRECPALYAACDAVFQPSLLECFSANYPEAMIMGKPIVASDLGFARTVCREAALYFEPVSVSEAVEKILLLTGDAGLRKQLVKRGKEIVNELPSATERAAQYLNICKELI